ncbi:peptidase S15 [Frankia sp. R43]|uniref:CocE/NonD family hydrolase n=1 Tax=Frankia sp. R43 TaxID=269536 RepID=UPI0006CA438D|nr:CocE/NonD family hydrolase [Frankia sp. R43]KPM53373.1 peptidase S15 [Frankia sp. R43]
MAAPRRTPLRRLAPVAALAVAALTASACLPISTGELSGQPSSPPSSGSVSAQPLSAQTKAWWSYDREATYQSITTKVTVPTRDGTQLSCTLVRPATSSAPAAGTFPGIVTEFTPYSLLHDTYVNSEATYFATRGYNALVCTLRGVGGSGGTWQNAMSAQDGKDGYDLVEWLAAQPFSNGRIGMTGESYGGDTTYATAINQPPHLVAIAPLQSPSDLYHDVIYPGGIKATEGGDIDNWPGTAELMSGGVINPANEYATNRAHPTYDDYWQSRSFLGRHDSINVPVFTMGGWVDQYFRSGELANIEGALGRTWAIYGQWTHLLPLTYPNCGPLCNSDGLAPGIVLAWFDHWIKQLPDVPIPAKPTFVSYAGATASAPGWREIVGYDPNDTATQSFALNTAGTTGTTGTASTTGTATTAAGTAGTVTFHQPQDPSTSGGSVLFQTSPLTTAMSIFGHSTLTLKATLSGTDANFYVELIDVGTDGKQTLVNNGFLRASHRTSDVVPMPVQAGESVTYTIPIRADDWQFAAGHRIALRISGGASSMLTQNSTPVDVAIATGAGGSALTLPTIS